MTFARETTRLIADRLRRFALCEDGNAIIEFLIWFPLFFYILLATVEAGFFVTRVNQLDRAVNIAVRDLRIGALGATVTDDTLRQRICGALVVFPDCMTDLRLELKPVNMTTWAGLDADPRCINRSETLNPAVENGSIQAGGSNQLMLVRACMLIDPFMPTTGFGLALPRYNSADSGVGVAMISTSTFVNEPRE